MALSAQLLQILVCPVDKAGLYYVADEDTLYNPRLRRRYVVREGIPVMLPEESEEVDDAEHERLLAKVAAEGLALTVDA